MVLGKMEYFQLHGLYTGIYTYIMYLVRIQLVKQLGAIGKRFLRCPKGKPEQTGLHPPAA